MFNIRHATPSSLHPLTAKAFYELVEECQRFARDLARLDPNHVHLESCYRFNRWLPTVRCYEQLAQSCGKLRYAWPVARWQLLTLGGLIWLILLLALRGRVERQLVNFISYGWLSLLVLFYFVPEHYYGETVESLEGKVLFVVDRLSELLLRGEVALSEAAFYRAKETLDATHHELRQQIDLAHRSG